VHVDSLIILKVRTTVIGYWQPDKKMDCNLIISKIYGLKEKPLSSKSFLRAYRQQYETFEEISALFNM
jgi:hypothetical protein